MHHKLIKEIHTKNKERLLKDSSICFDERGNIISNNDSSHSFVTTYNSSEMVKSNEYIHRKPEEDHENLNESSNISCKIMNNKTEIVNDEMQKSIEIFESMKTDSSSKNELTSRSMLSEARAKLEAFSAKFPVSNLNEGTEGLNNIKLEVTKNKMYRNSIQNTNTPTVKNHRQNIKIKNNNLNGNNADLFSKTKF